MYEPTYYCKIGNDPETCICSCCTWRRDSAKSKTNLEAAERANLSTGSTISSIGIVISPEVPRVSLKNRLEAQRLENIRANDRAYELAQTRTPKIPPNNMVWPPFNPLAPKGSQEIKVEYQKPIVSIAVLSLEEARELYLAMGGKDTVSSSRAYLELAEGGVSAHSTAQGLGGLGVAATTKTINGKDWVIIRNFRRHQQVLMKGNKWGANNPRVVKAGLGLNDFRGAVRYVRFNAGIEVAFSVGINAADYILRDDASLSELGVNTSSDLAKGFISLAGAALFTAAIVPTTVGVLGTSIVFASVSFIIGIGLDEIDKEMGYTIDITKAIKEHLR